MIPIGKKYSIDAVFALTKAEDIWRGMENAFMITVRPHISQNTENYHASEQNR